MPIYEYRCKKCSFKVEMIVSQSYPRVTVCQSCGENSLTRQVCNPRFQLSGSGWFTDGYESRQTQETAE